MSANSTLVRLGYDTDVGRVRDHNEDNLGWSDPAQDEQALQRRGRLYVVADGMGGHAAGEVASEIAVDVIIRQYETDDDLDVATVLECTIQAANAEIHQQAQSGARAGMGTTVVCAVVRGDELFVAHVGDSRAYLFRDDALRLLTRDHTLVNEQVKQQIISPEEAEHHPQQHVLSRVLGRKPQVFVDIADPIRLESGDVILLCTDGVSGYVDDTRIAYALQTNPDAPQIAADTLVDLANATGGYDNATAVVLLVEKVVHLSFKETFSWLRKLTKA